MNPAVLNATNCNGLDGFESINASEWDEGPMKETSADQQEMKTGVLFGNMENEKVLQLSCFQNQIHCIVIGR